MFASFYYRLLSENSNFKGLNRIIGIKWIFWGDILSICCKKSKLCNIDIMLKNSSKFTRECCLKSICLCWFKSVSMVYCCFVRMREYVFIFFLISLSKQLQANRYSLKHLWNINIYDFNLNNNKSWHAFPINCSFDFVVMTNTLYPK